MSSSKKPVIPAPIPTSNIERSDQKVCYRDNNSLGKALVKTLEDMKAAGTLSQELVDKILIHFDINIKLATATPRMRLRCQEVVNVKAIDNVYNCILKQVDISIKGIGFTNNDQAVINRIPEIKLEMWPCAGSLKAKAATKMTATKAATTTKTDDEEMN